MIVKEVIEALSKFDPELTVCVSGYEGGVTEKLHISKGKVITNYHEEGYFGEHEQDSWGSDKGTKEVVLIER